MEDQRNEGTNQAQGSQNSMENRENKSEPGNKSNYKKNNRQHVVENYSLGQWSERIGHLYEELMATHNCGLSL